MKTIAKLIGLVSGFLTAGVLMAATALAQYPPPSGLPTEVVEKKGAAEAAEAAQGEVAFTGLDLSVWIAVIVALVAVGALLLYLGRRRRAAVR